MQIVIDINENVYTRLFDNGTDFYDTDDILAMAKSIRKGTPLPKHGDLIDADAYYKDIKNHYFDNATVIRCTEIGLNNAHKIIAANTESEK